MLFKKRNYLGWEEFSRLEKDRRFWEIVNNKAEDSYRKSMRRLK